MPPVGELMMMLKYWNTAC